MLLEFILRAKFTRNFNHYRGTASTDATHFDLSPLKMLFFVCDAILGLFSQVGVSRVNEVRLNLIAKIVRLAV